MRVYLDACCASRLTDDQTQPRIRSEAAAVECVLQMVRDGEATWVSFDALHLASAERGCVDVFLTTDDDLVRRALRSLERLRVRVQNPVP